MRTSVNHPDVTALMLGVSLSTCAETLPVWDTVVNNQRQSNAGEQAQPRIITESSCFSSTRILGQQELKIMEVADV